MSCQSPNNRVFSRFSAAVLFSALWRGRERGNNINDKKIRHITNNANTCTTRQFCPLADARLPPKSSVLWKLKTFIAKKFYQENGSMTDCCGRMVQRLYWYKKCWAIFLDVELKLNSLQTLFSWALDSWCNIFTKKFQTNYKFYLTFCLASIRVFGFYSSSGLSSRLELSLKQLIVPAEFPRTSISINKTI